MKGEVASYENAFEKGCREPGLCGRMLAVENRGFAEGNRALAEGFRAFAAGNRAFALEKLTIA